MSSVVGHAPSPGSCPTTAELTWLRGERGPLKMVTATGSTQQQGGQLPSPDNGLCCHLACRLEPSRIHHLSRRFDGMSLHPCLRLVVSASSPLRRESQSSIRPRPPSGPLCLCRRSAAETAPLWVASDWAPLRMVSGTFRECRVHCRPYRDRAAVLSPPMRAADIQRTLMETTRRSIRPTGTSTTQMQRDQS